MDVTYVLRIWRRKLSQHVQAVRSRDDMVMWCDVKKLNFRISSHLASLFLDCLIHNVENGTKKSS